MDDLLRASVGDISPEDDFRPAYQGAYDQRQRAENDAWLRSMASDGEAPEASAESAPPATSGQESAAQVEDDEGGGLWDYAKAAGSGALSVAGDLVRGGTEAIPQAFGGMVDALDEAAYALQSIIPMPGVELFDDEGNFSPSWLSSSEMTESMKADETLLDMIAPKEAESVTGGIVRAGAQFLTGFLPGMQASRAMGLGKVAAGFAAGAFADAVVFDPHEARLSTFLNEVPGLQAIVPDYLASHGAENESEWEGRLKNAIEGAGLGAMAEGLFSVFKYYKAQRSVRPAGEPQGAMGQAAIDQQNAAARAQIEMNVSDDMLAPLGDASDAAPLLIEARPSESLQNALVRLGEADARAAQMEQNGASIQRITEIIEGKKRNIDQGTSGYQGGADGHRAPRPENGARPISDVSGAWPDDFYSREGLSVYGDGSPHDAKAKKIIDGLRDKPDAEITIYRAIPKGEGEVINAGDWVSLTREYAADHGDGALGGDFTIVSKKVKASEVFTDGNSIHEWGYNPKSKPNSRVPTGETTREAIDDALDELRSGAVSKAKFAARPVANIVRELGGIDPSSSLAGDLRSRGITTRSFPGLYRKGGLQSLDNIPASEHRLLVENSGQRPDGYVDQQAFVDGLEAELRGEPWRTADERAMFDEIVAPAQELDEHLSRLGIDYENMSNDAVKARLKEISDEQEAWRNWQERATARISDEGQPRTYAELADEQREIWTVEQTAEARSQGVDEAIIQAHQPAKVYVNLARIKGAEDVKALIQTMADADAAHIKDKQRGVVSNAQTIKESSQEWKDLNDLVGRAPGPMSASQAVAARKILASSAEQVMQLAKIASSPNAGKVDLYNFRRAASVHAAIQAEVIGARTETARALQSWSIPVGADKVRTDAINDLLANNMGGDLQKLARQIANTSDEAALNDMTRQLVGMRVRDAVYSVYVNGLLSGPKTHMVNAMSNAAVAMYAIPERYLAETFSNAFGKGDVVRGEAQAMAYGMIEGIRDGVRLMTLGPKAEGMANLGELWEQFGKTEMRANPISGAAFGLDPNSTMYRGLDAMGAIIGIPGTMLERGDLFFKSLNYRMELHALAFREAKLSGLEGKEFADKMADTLRNPPAHVAEEANRMALVNTFTNPLGEKGRMVQRAISSTPLRWAMPFVRTPTNIMKYTFERTPLAYASSAIRADIAAGGARAAQAQARVAMGTMLMMSFAGLALDGVVSGGGPLDPKQRKAMEQDGWQPYSVKIGDKWYSYSRLDPLGMMLGMSADLAEITTNPRGDASDDMVVMAGVTAFVQNMASKTYAQGAFELAAALDPRNPAGSPAQFFNRQATGLIPFSAALRQTAQAIDPTIRESRDEVTTDEGKPDALASWLNRLVNDAKRGIPGLSDTLPPVRDIFGDPMTRESGVGAAWDMIMPIQARQEKNDPVLRAIIDNELKVDRPSRQVAGINLSADQYDELQVIAGGLVRQQLDALVRAPMFKNLTSGPDGMQAQLIKSTIERMHRVARDQLLMKDPELRDKRNSKIIRNQNLLLGN